MRTVEQAALVRVRLDKSASMKPQDQLGGKLSCDFTAVPLALISYTT
jgi:hypothetical protein